MNIKNEIIAEIGKYNTIIDFHGYYVDKEQKSIAFDLIFDFKEKNIAAKKADILKSLKNKYPQYRFDIVIDADFSD